ncbi:hypothetical protein [Moraxella oblonga]|uniref:hypothetical protein n=1 Tax=Moraxella oblonga TaxID=200413 RepID=UPI000834657E|nr:hypothetical protein [Moraxella oblonga]
MIDQLQLLEQTILELKARYNVTATELVNLKHKLAHDDAPRQISELQEQVDRLTAHNSSLNRELDELTKTKELLNTQIDNLYQQNKELTEKNQELTEKNELAISRAEIIQEWLTKIDNQTI